jgi:alkylation response protein AidB-like acyl-CoA dehydrogenase
MFLATILSHGSDEQKGWWAGRTMKGEMIGCYAQSK